MKESGHWREKKKNENYSYLEELEADTIKQTEMKEKIRKEYLRIRKLFDTQQYRNNQIKGINTSGVSLVICSGHFLK